MQQLKRHQRRIGKDWVCGFRVGGTTAIVPLLRPPLVQTTGRHYLPMLSPLHTQLNLNLHWLGEICSFHSGDSLRLHYTQLSNCWRHILARQQFSPGVLSKSFLQQQSTGLCSHTSEIAFGGEQPALARDAVLLEQILVICSPEAGLSVIWDLWVATGSALSPNLNLHWPGEFNLPNPGDSLGPHFTQLTGLRLFSAAETYRHLSGSLKTWSTLGFCWVF